MPWASTQDSKPDTQLLHGSFMSERTNGQTNGRTDRRMGCWRDRLTAWTRPGEPVTTVLTSTQRLSPCCGRRGGGTRGVRSQGCKGPATRLQRLLRAVPRSRSGQGLRPRCLPLLGPTGYPTLPALSLSAGHGEKGSCCGSSAALSRTALLPPVP